MTKKLFIPNLRTRQELIGNNLMEVVDDYPDQLRVVIDELVSHLNHQQLDAIEDLIVNNYHEDFSADDVQECITEGTDYSECVDHLVQSMNKM